MGYSDLIVEYWQYDALKPIYIYSIGVVCMTLFFIVVMIIYKKNGGEFDIKWTALLTSIFAWPLVLFCFLIISLSKSCEEFIDKIQG